LFLDIIAQMALQLVQQLAGFDPGCGHFPPPL
jgi:hypothetical protein